MNNNIQQKAIHEEHVPVLIVGGSLIGLSTALFLARHGIQCLLVERHAGISPFPRAGGFNPRTMELLREAGVEEAIRRAEPPDIQNRSILRVETLAGKELQVFAQNLSDFFYEFSPVRGSVITQNLMEPVLRAYAEELGADLRFNTEFVGFEENITGVTARIRQRLSGEERIVHARYLVAADGNDSSIRRQSGIAVHGPGTLQNIVNIMIRADLREVLRGRRILVCYITRTQGFFGGDDDGGLVAVPYFPEKGEREADFAGPRGVEAIRESIGVPDLAVEIDEVRTWEMAAFVAERFQQGRIFLVGDSAHVMPPTGGYGANTGIADAHNLAWKLAYVLKGQAGPELLATYDAERRPVAQLTVDQAFANFIERVDASRAAERTEPQLDFYTPVFGYLYHSTAVIAQDDNHRLYIDPYRPTGQPGARAPHVVLARNNGQHEQLSTLDLFGRRFVLLTGTEGHTWHDAARRAAERLSIDLESYCIGAQGDFVDVDGDWLATYGITPDGAVLVRPDGFVAWRQSGERASEAAGAQLERALTRLLSR